MVLEKGRCGICKTDLEHNLVWAGLFCPKCGTLVLPDIVRYAIEVGKGSTRNIDFL